MTDTPPIFSRPWYNRYFELAENSTAHAEFCRRVYGADLCQHGMMDMAELDFLIGLLQPGWRILEIGCGNGHISEYIYHKSQPAHMLAIDYSDVAIAQAQSRTTDLGAALQFACLDLSQELIPGEGYDAIIAIDSIYFLGDFSDSLPPLYKRLRNGGLLLVSAFEYQDEGDPPENLLPEKTFMAQTLKQLEYDYTQHDFSQNMRDHWLANYQVAIELAPAFIKEGARFLFEARKAENVEMKIAAEAGRLARYLYVIQRR